MRKNSGKELFGAVVGLGFVALLVIYFLVFQKYNEKTAALKTQNNTLRTEVNDMKQYYDNRLVYAQDIKDMRAEVDKIATEYPADAREEDVIMLGVDMQNKATVDYSSIGMPDPSQLYVVTFDEVQAFGSESFVDEVDFVERKATYNCTLDYDNLKTCIEEIYKNPNRIAIYNINFVRGERVLTDEEVAALREAAGLDPEAEEDGDDAAEKEDEVVGILAGSIDLAFYSMTGTGKEYKAPDMPSYEMGTTNPFNLSKFSDTIRQ